MRCWKTERLLAAAAADASHHHAVGFYAAHHAHDDDQADQLHQDHAAAAAAFALESDPTVNLEKKSLREPFCSLPDATAHAVAYVVPDTAETLFAVFEAVGSCTRKSVATGTRSSSSAAVGSGNAQCFNVPSLATRSASPSAESSHRTPAASRLSLNPRRPLSLNCYYAPLLRIRVIGCIAIVPSVVGVVVVLPTSSRVLRRLVVQSPCSAVVRERIAPARQETDRVDRARMALPLADQRQLRRAHTHVPQTQVACTATATIRARQLSGGSSTRCCCASASTASCVPHEVAPSDPISSTNSNSIASHAVLAQSCTCRARVGDPCHLITQPSH